MKSTHPDYPILMPNTAYLKISLCLQGGSKKILKIEWRLKIILTRVCKKIF